MGVSKVRVLMGPWGRSFSLPLFWQSNCRGSGARARKASFSFVVTVRVASGSQVFVRAHTAMTGYTTSEVIRGATVRPPAHAVRGGGWTAAWHSVTEPTCSTHRRETFVFTRGATDPSEGRAWLIRGACMFWCFAPRRSGNPGASAKRVRPGDVPSSLPTPSPGPMCPGGVPFFFPRAVRMPCTALCTQAVPPCCV